jgi:acyl-CoA thioester hydrolase
MIKPYERKTNYYETDQMAIIHHSNYVRYLEEAKLYYMEQFGLPYSYVEEQGILIPVLGVSVEYEKSNSLRRDCCDTRMDAAIFYSEIFNLL